MSAINGNSDYGSGWKEVERNGKDVKIAVIPGAEGTYCVVTHPAPVAQEIIQFFGQHPL
ncbi:MAG: hypothetical protein PVH42_21290 [Desulfobacterales bacterium]